MNIRELAKASEHASIVIYVIMSIVAVMLMVSGKMLFGGCLLLVEFIVGSILFAIGEIADVCSDIN